MQSFDNFWIVSLDKTLNIQLDALLHIYDITLRKFSIFLVWSIAYKCQHQAIGVQSVSIDIRMNFSQIWMKLYMILSWKYIWKFLH